MLASDFRKSAGHQCQVLAFTCKTCTVTEELQMKNMQAVRCMATGNPKNLVFFFFLSCCKQLEILLMSSSELCCLTIVNKVLYVRREQHLVPIRETKQVHMSTRRYKKWLHSENILFHRLKQVFFVIVVCFLNFLPIYCLILLYVFKLHV